MKTIHNMAIVALLLAGSDVYAGSGVQAVKQTLQGYEQAWSRHDGPAIASFYYEPAMRVSKAGPLVRSTRAAEEAFFDGFVQLLVVKGYDHSDWQVLHVHLLNARTAIASGVVTRYRRDGSILQRQGVTYDLWRTDQGWKIFLSATHAPQSALQFH